VLVVSPGAFNRLTKVPIVLPITTGGDFARIRGFAVSLAGAARAPPVSFVVISRGLSTSTHAAGESSRACLSQSLTKSWPGLHLCSTGGEQIAITPTPARYAGRRPG
jgi:hypothetical protein